MSVINIQQQLQELSLLGIAKTIETDLAIASKQDWGHTELLSKLLQSEKVYRDDRAMEKKVKSAAFKRNAFIEDFDLTIKRGVTKTQLQELISMRWLERAQPVVFVGQTGMGKSFKAKAHKA